MGMSILPNLNIFYWYFRRLFLGFYNIITLKGYTPIHLVIVMYKSFCNMNNCNDYENLYSLYS